jgi:hypothetical protein
VDVAVRSETHQIDMNKSSFVRKLLYYYLFIGYLLNIKNVAGDWEEFEVSSNTNSRLLQPLLCGSTYQVFLTAFNKIGSGLPSNILTRTTKGHGEIQLPKDKKRLSNSFSFSSCVPKSRDVHPAHKPFHHNFKTRPME